MPPWLSSFRSALLQNRRQRHVQVATASAEGGPTVRTVVLRQVLDDGTLIFFTDARSEKVRDLEEDPRVEIHAWWTKGRTQFRIRGRAALSVDDRDTGRRAEFERLSEEDLVRFHEGPPGEPLAAEPSSDPETTSLGGPLSEPLTDAAAPNSEPETAPKDALRDAVPSTFVLVRVRPERVDRLVLGPEGHVRHRFEKTSQGWDSTPTRP